MMLLGGPALRVGLALLAVGSLSGCAASTQPDAEPTGDAATSDAPAASATPPTPSPTAGTAASLSILERRADWSPQGRDQYEEASDGQPLSVSDLVRTDAEGFAEITYRDGSLTRLDVDTEVEVLRLDVSVRAPDVELEMDVGRVWNHLRDDPATAYVLRTHVATATVRGTTFIVDCPAPISCTFIVLEGTVEITDPDGQVLATLEGGQGLAVTTEPDGDPDQDPSVTDTPQAVTVAAADPWVQRNADRDGIELPADEPVRVTVSGVLAYVSFRDGVSAGFLADDGTLYCTSDALSDGFTYVSGEDAGWLRVEDGERIADMPDFPEDGGPAVGTQRFTISGLLAPGIGPCGAAPGVLVPEEFLPG